MPSFSPLRSQLFLRRFANNNFQSVRNIQQDEAEMEERWSGKDTRRSDRMRGGRRGGRGGGRGSDNRGGRGGGGGTSKWEGKQKRIEAARHTVQVLDSGVYVNKQGNEVDISTALSNAINGSILYERDHVWPSLGSAEPRETVIEVWAMTTLQACMKLVAAGDSGKIGKSSMKIRKMITNYYVGTSGCLNFASARHPGGGFLGGAQAQEESLARTSGLYACLTSAHCKKMYLINQQNKSCLYSHRIIYSPDVPVFKDDDGAILDEWYSMNFISAPAVNAGVVRKRDRNADGVLIIAISFSLSLSLFYYSLLC